MATGNSSPRTGPDDLRQAVSSDLQTQWQDHFHMRDQTWKVLQMSIFFFLGVVGLELRGVPSEILVVAYAAVLMVSAMGVMVAVHHRLRQKEKFEIIKIYERELGLDKLIAPVLDGAKRSLLGRVNTPAFIVVMQGALSVVSLVLLLRTLMN